MNEPVPDREMLRAIFAAEQIAPTAADAMSSPYRAIAEWIAARHSVSGKPLIVGICGAQGSGKSTLARGVAMLIERRMGLRVATLSIDDFYLSRTQRLALAADRHPLFATRGVPGTHDTVLAENTIAQLTGAGPDVSTLLPRFDKASDDVCPAGEWPCFTGRADIVLFEGWCVGARAEATAPLAIPVNHLEAAEDPDGVWRSGVNAALAGPYQRLFARIDLLLVILAPSFDAVFAWRCEQEHKLARRTPAGKAIMDDAALRRFIAHYERLTRHILAEMPARADGLMALDDARAVKSLRLQRRHSLSAGTARHRP